MGRKRKLLTEYVREFPDLEIAYKQVVQENKEGASTSDDSSTVYRAINSDSPRIVTYPHLVCKACRLDIQSRTDRITEHISSQRHSKLKAHLLGISADNVRQMSRDKFALIPFNSTSAISLKKTESQNFSPNAFKSESQNYLLSPNSTSTVTIGEFPAIEPSTSTSDSKNLKNISIASTSSDELYPEIEPFSIGKLKVSDIHDIYYEECGNKTGNPVLFLHGGPGSGCQPRDRRYFDPSVYRIILFDQRGCGRSFPRAEVRENNTWNLIKDIEKLRVYLAFEKWIVFGGSWGSTLALLYAQVHPDHVKALILRGIFTVRRKELLWMYQDGANHIFPDFWEEFVEPIPEVERGDMMSAYYRRLIGSEEKERLKCARAWSNWEMMISRLNVDKDDMMATESDLWCIQHSTIECHYFVHGAFLEFPDQILLNVHKIRHIPAIIVQGRYDIVCPMDTTWQLHKRWPEAELYIVGDAGHSAKEAGITALLVQATEKYKNI